MHFSNKRALVTGGTGALGRVVLERCSKAGFTVATSCRPGEEHNFTGLASTWGVHVIPADVALESDVALLFDRAVSLMGGVDVLVNIAGGYAGGTPIKDLRLAEWDAMMDQNLKSVFLCAREMLRRLAPGSGGRIVSIAAMPALRPAPNRAAYAVSKAGVIALTEMLGAELKGTSVTANAIAPSIIDTPANRASMPGEEYSRWVAPGDIAEQILFFSADEASSINGVCIPMFGGI